MPGCRRNDRVDGNRQRWSSAEGGPAGRCNAGSSIGGLAGGYNTGSSVGSLAGGYNTGSRTGSLAGGYRTGGSVRGYHGDVGTGGCILGKGDAGGTQTGTGGGGKPGAKKGGTEKNHARAGREQRAKKRKRRLWGAAAVFLLLGLGYTYHHLGQVVPDRLNLIAGEQEELRLPLFFQSTLAVKDKEVSLLDPSDIPSDQIKITGSQPFRMLGTKEGSYQMEVRLFGFLKVKDVQVDVVGEDYAIPCGIPIGIYLKSNGILVIGTGTLTSADGMSIEPAYGILRSGDYIEAINGKPLSRKEELVEAVDQAGADRVTLRIRRGQEEMDVSIDPVEDTDGRYKLGAWVRDDTQGIGTMTYLDMNGHFGALGHGISDSDTGEVVEIQEGALYETQILGIERGDAGTPGVMSGVIYYGPGSLLGQIEANTETGIFGTAGDSLRSRVADGPIPIGYRQDVKVGPAFLRSSVSGEVKDHQIQIRKVDQSGTHRTKSIVFEVTDPELLALTGGVIQGMSGSPIIQEGKLVGAVTHVFVQDSTKGYGIFIENMIKH